VLPREKTLLARACQKYLIFWNMFSFGIKWNYYYTILSVGCHFRVCLVWTLAFAKAVVGCGPWESSCEEVVVRKIEIHLVELLWLFRNTLSLTDRPHMSLTQSLLPSLLSLTSSSLPLPQFHGCGSRPGDAVARAHQLGPPTRRSWGSPVRGRV
jgi:hypothetical protein